ncbi:MAG: LuxR C-terminal-related transcriptional regulator [Actinomycetota bacterium]|nr:LuxR C-terminal-related transcriptional regulator [Actinomycetota bacterium]
MSRPLDQLAQGRDSFAQQSWADAYAHLSEADGQTPLESADLERLAVAAYLLGRDGESLEVLGRAHHESLDKGDTERAIRCTFWLGFQLIFKGDMAQASGWFARGRRLLEEDKLDCVEQGYMLVPLAVQSLHGRDFATAQATFGRAAEIGKRFGDLDLTALAGFGRGQALIGLGESTEGLTLLDEVMVGVTTGEVSALVSGLVYCGVISSCQEVFDLRRAQEWTQALTHWCASQPDLVPYRGQCLVHRAQIMLLHGAWAAAMEEAERARETLARAPDRGAVGMAFYELGELHRLRGNFAEAEDSYRQASHWGHAPQPGLARLRLAQGEVGAAEAAIRRATDEARDLVTRSKILPAQVEIMLAAGDVPAARVAADELSKIAADVDAPLLRAIAAFALGAVLRAEGDVRAALAELRHAWRIWRDLGAPREAARARVLIGMACRELGDEDTAGMELDAARLAFQELGAEPDLADMEELSQRATSQAADGLTGREVEVLALVATGKTNREIATDLVISEKTVARHVSNIFIKLGVTSRAAATAYAYRHDLA